MHQIPTIPAAIDTTRLLSQDSQTAAQAPQGGEGSLTREQAVRLAERYVGAYNSRDLQAMLAVQDENIVSHPSRLAGAQRHEGHAGVRAWWETTLASGRWYDVVIGEIRQPASDRVAIIGEIHDHGEPVSPWCVVIRVRNGLIVESHSYLSETDLLDQLGLLNEAP